MSALFLLLALIFVTKLQWKHEDHMKARREYWKKQLEEQGK